jgi:hypothetical protein
MSSQDKRVPSEKHFREILQPCSFQLPYLSANGFLCKISPKLKKSNWNPWEATALWQYRKMCSGFGLFLYWQSFSGRV